MGGGKLKVKVVNGRNLQNKETLSTSDPYCKVEVGGVVHKTKTKKGNLNPDWNQDFEFEVKPEHLNDVIALSIWDNNTFKKDEFMGYSFVTFDDCKKGKDTEKKAVMLGDCKGEINLIVTPDFETSATKIEIMEVKIKEVDNTGDAKSKLGEEIKSLTEEKEKLEKDNKTLNEQIKTLEGNNNTLSEETKTLSLNNENLKKDKKELQNNNEHLSSNIDMLNQQIENLKNETQKLKIAEESIVVNEVQEQFGGKSFEDVACKRDEIHKKLSKENEKIHDIKLDLLQELLGFQTVQEIIFMKLNEQLRTMQNDKNKVEDIKEELRQQIMGFEKLQELIFQQFQGKIQNFDLSVLKQIVEDIKDMQ